MFQSGYEPQGGGMWPLLAAAAIPAVASAFGQSQANKQNVRLSREGMAFEADQVAKQMQFQERMSSTAYQRATEDMRLAGINPMLAYAQGGAATPGGGAASGAAATVQDVVGPAVASAQHARRLQQELRNMREQEELTYNQSLRERNAAELAAGQLQTEYARQDQIRAETAATRAGTPGIAAQSARRGVFTPAYNWARGVSERLFNSDMVPRAGRIARYELSRPFSRR